MNIFDRQMFIESFKRELEDLKISSDHPAFYSYQRLFVEGAVAYDASVSSGWTQALRRSVANDRDMRELLMDDESINGAAMKFLTQFLIEWGTAYQQLKVDIQEYGGKAEKTFIIGAYYRSNNPITDTMLKMLAHRVDEGEALKSIDPTKVIMLVMQLGPEDEPGVSRVGDIEPM